MVKIEDLRLDNKENPRLPNKLVGATDQEIAKYMVLKGNVLALMESIGEKGFFPGEPLLVTKENDRDGFVVVEGNRRLTAVLLLRNPNLCNVKRATLRDAVKAAHKKNIPAKLPVIVYSYRDEILDYLGYRHITGIKEWGPLSKAKYLRKLYKRSNAATPNEKCRELARIIGSRSDYVRKLLCGLKVYDEINDSGILGDDLEDVSFSLITTALGYTNIQEFIGLESGEEIAADSLIQENLEEFTVWLFKEKEGTTRLGESRNLGMLSEVVGNPEALEEFRNGTPLEDAYFISGGAKETVLKAINTAYNRLDIAFRFSRNNVVLTAEEITKLDDILKTTRAIKKLVMPDYD